MKSLWLSALAISCCLSGQVHASRLTLMNTDPAGKGLNDPTPRTPVGDNPGRSVGEQRRIVYQYAADLWGSVLESDVDIIVGASFQDLRCLPTTGVLGSAGPAWVATSAPEASSPGMLIHGPLANAMQGKRIDISDSGMDIASRFNANLGGTNPDGSPCLTGLDWHYGLDGQAPQSGISFLDVVMHEMAHGLGFSGFVGYGNGRLGDRLGVPELYGYSDSYTQLAFDNLQGKPFADTTMTDAMRALSIRTPGAPSWSGPAAIAAARLWLRPSLQLVVEGGAAPPLVTYNVGTAAFGPALPNNVFSGDLALANDASGGDPADACEALPTDSLKGRIAFINRGSCDFEAKVANAQAAGAVAAIIGNVASSPNPNSTLTMSDVEAYKATIPAIQLTLADSDRIRAGLKSASLKASTTVAPNKRVGSDLAGRPLLYAPPEVEQGSSFSHFDYSASPNVLMEPSASDDTDAAHLVDLTLGTFADQGWTLNPGNARIGDCDTGVKLFKQPGLMAGANVQAQDRVCRLSAKGSRVTYLRCMSDNAATLRSLQLINSIEQTAIRACAAKVIKLD
ncbi:MAG: PA domain-containing protein [Stenotrophomonas sp.]